MNSEPRTLGAQRRLTRTLTQLTLGTALILLMLAGGLLLAPSLNGIAQARGAQLGGLVESRLGRLDTETGRLLQIAAAWLTGEGLALNHQSLNARFMPILEQYPEYAEVRVADSSGSEWMLRHRSDGTWLNRLNRPHAKDNRQRFLEWSTDRTLSKDERRPSDYASLRQPWVKKALAAPRGQILWSEVHLLAKSRQVGITAAMRLAATGERELLLSLDLRLANLAPNVNKLGLGHKGLAILLSIQGRLLELSELSGEAASRHAVFQSVVGLELGPLKRGINLWLGRGAESTVEHVILHNGTLWHVSFRRIGFGDEGLWLGVFLPLSDLLPHLYLRLALPLLVVLVAWGSVLLMGRRLGKAFRVPLEELAVRSYRIGGLDFAPLPPIQSSIREIRHLALVQNEMRDALSYAYQELQHGHQESEQQARSAQ
jgi:hypothetical protein